MFITRRRKLLHELEVGGMGLLPSEWEEAIDAALAQDPYEGNPVIDCTDGGGGGGGGGGIGSDLSDMTYTGCDPAFPNAICIDSTSGTPPGVASSGPPLTNPYYNDPSNDPNAGPFGPLQAGAGGGGGRGRGNNSKPSKAGCLLRGVVVGAGGAILVAGGVVVAGAVGVPAAVTTGVLLVGGAVGLASTAASTYNNMQSGNYAGAAYDVGSVMGGVAAGSVVAGVAADSITPSATRGWSLSKDLANRWTPSKGWNPIPWLATGPDVPAAGGSIAAAASKLASFLRGPC